ncbi:LysM peptidoglycan-binding domain-containing protein [Winogradskyella sp. R77965]|uniref:LysM peptidoglycan-binding domain-containing protein n=1 Tax=Winogradskyella sp. R77965 TaxID=3093872 RepID=UPI0037DC03E9
MGKFFTLFIILVLSSKLATAQQNIIEHSIKKGESVYSISRTYGVSMTAIFRLNPGSEDIIYAGRTLRVPQSNPPNASNNTVISESQISNYEVKRGETKSGLSRRFGVSIAMLEQQNPHIVRMLQAGHIINLDKTIKEEPRQAREGEHIVVKGETLWGIARRNGISVQLLTAANANQLSEFLQIGQTLVIPDKNSDLPIAGEYLVKRGDTKFELARRFNMSIAELEAKNPHIIDMLMAGHKLNVDNTVATVDTSISNEITDTNEVTDTQIDPTNTAEDTTDGRYVDYVIQPKETLFSLSRKAGMTIDQLTTLNPKLLTAVNVGAVIKMPIDPTQNNIDSNSFSTNSSNQVDEIETNRNAALFANLDTSNTNGLYFYTPFSGNELSSPELRQKMLNNNDNYEKYLDFFQGSQMAIDSALALNLNFDITLIKESDVESKLKIESTYRKNAILVPFLENRSRFPELESNEVISIIDISSNISSVENSIIYKAIPSENFQKTKTLNYIASQDSQIIVVSDLEEARNKDLIVNTIPEAKFLQVDNAGFFKDNELELALKKDRLNYIVLDSEKTIVFLNSTTTLMSKLSDYSIQLVLIDDSLIPKQSEVSDLRYKVLKLIFPTNMDQNNSKVKSDFKNNYEALFNKKPSKHAILGFDITLDVLLRLSQNSSFKNTIETITSEHPHLKFEYKKTNDINYSNTGLYLLQYDSIKGLIELD